MCLGERKLFFVNVFQEVAGFVKASYQPLLFNAWKYTLLLNLWHVSQLTRILLNRCMFLYYASWSHCFMSLLRLCYSLICSLFDASFCLHFPKRCLAVFYLELCINRDALQPLRALRSEQIKKMNQTAIQNIALDWLNYHFASD